MPVFKRVRLERDFTVLRNTMIRDPKLSFQSVGLLSYLLSQIDEWEISINQLSNVKDRNGRSMIQTTLNELIDNGYLYRIRVRKKNGGFDGYDYYYSDQKDFHLGEEFQNFLKEIGESTVCGKPEYGKSVSGKSVSGKPVTNKNYREEELFKENLKENSSKEVIVDEDVKKLIEFLSKKNKLKYKDGIIEIVDYFNSKEGKSKKYKTYAQNIFKALEILGGVENAKLVMDYKIEMYRRDNNPQWIQLDTIFRTSSLEQWLDKALEKKEIIEKKESGWKGSNNEFYKKFIGEKILTEGFEYLEKIVNLNTDKDYERVCSRIKKEKIELLKKINRNTVLERIEVLMIRELSSLVDGSMLMEDVGLFNQIESSLF
jgi:uncharacterized phage protein (TIGR02220 family)